MSHLGEHSNLNATEIDIIVEKAVRKTFITLGADLSDNRSLQALQKDFAYMRRQRVGGEKMGDGIRSAAIVAFMGGLLWALWQGLKIALVSKGVPVP
jgi:hypothetical protein